MADDESQDGSKNGLDTEEVVPTTMPPYTIDVDAIANSKSLGDAMRLLAPQLEGLPRRRAAASCSVGRA